MTQARSERIHRCGRICHAVDVAVSHQPIVDEIDKSVAELRRVKPPRVVQLVAKRADPRVAAACRAVHLTPPGPLDATDRLGEVEDHDDHRRNARDNAAQHEHLGARVGGRE